MIELEQIYKRYNQFGEYEDYYTVNNPNTMIQIYLESKYESVDMEKRISELELNGGYYDRENPKLMLSDKYFEQPKSIFVRFNMLSIILNAISKRCYYTLGIEPNSIMDITVAIVFYYLGLQTYKFLNFPIDATEKKNIIGRDDFFVDLQTLQKVRGVTSERELSTFLHYYSTDIDLIQYNKYSGIYREKNVAFILCIYQFVDYVIFKTEELFINVASEDEKNNYWKNKGKLFEMSIQNLCQNIFPECFKTVFYRKDNQRYELDIVLRDDENIAILECKSGTFGTFDINSDKQLIDRLANKTRDAYIQLQRVNKYLRDNKSYEFNHMKNSITGICDYHISIHITMYSMDFIASNLHAEFNKFLDKEDPILTISYEHLFALLLDAKDNNIDLWEYWKRRQKYIREYPEMHFDINELDLYYELKDPSQNTMLIELIDNGFLKMLNPKGLVVGSFKDQFGMENRPSSNMIRRVDEIGAACFFREGKVRHDINRRYLKNLESFLKQGND